MYHFSSLLYDSTGNRTSTYCVKSEHSTTGPWKRSKQAIIIKSVNQTTEQLIVSLVSCSLQVNQDGAGENSPRRLRRTIPSFYAMLKYCISYHLLCFTLRCRLNDNTDIAYSYLAMSLVNDSDFVRIRQNMLVVFHDVFRYLQKHKIVCKYLLAINPVTGSGHDVDSQRHFK